MIRFSVAATGFSAPGLEDHAALARHMDGAPYEPETGWEPRPATLPPRQARRLSQPTRLAIMAAEQIADALPANAAWVFASSTGEGVILNEILTSLSTPPVMVQPVRFQNAVHNAAQGQWSIAAGSTSAGTSIAAFDDTAGAGFLKAMLQARVEGCAIGLVLYDYPLPEPLHEKRPFSLPMAAALALIPQEGRGLAPLLQVEHASSAETPLDAHPVPVASALVNSGNPVRHVLALLDRLHSGSAAPVTLKLTGGSAMKLHVVQSD